MIINFHVGTPQEHFVWVRSNPGKSMTKIDVKYVPSEYRCWFKNYWRNHVIVAKKSGYWA